jgi:hypothetical protein
MAKSRVFDKVTGPYFVICFPSPVRRLDPTCASTGAGDGIGVATMIPSIWNLYRSNGPGLRRRLGLKTRVEKEVFHAIDNA